jgi:hypothetical protein
MQDHSLGKPLLARVMVAERVRWPWCKIAIRTAAYDVYQPEGRLHVRIGSESTYAGDFHGSGRYAWLRAGHSGPGRVPIGLCVASHGFCVRRLVGLRYGAPEGCRTVRHCAPSYILLLRIVPPPSCRSR